MPAETAICDAAPEGLQARTVPTGSARGATGWQPRVDSTQEALGLVDSAHLHTSEKKNEELTRS